MGNNFTGTIGGKRIIGTLGSGHIVMGKNVIPDWNQNDPQAEDYIKNRPGGYDVPPIVDISWDGDMTGKEKVQMAEGVYLVKIANEAPTFESFNADKAFLEVGIIYDGTTSSESGETTIRLDESGDAYAIGDIALGVSSDYFENEGMMFSKGLWFMWVGQAEKTKFVKRITSLDGAVKFHVKYMPNDITSGIREAQITASEAKTAATTAQETAEQAIGADVIKDNYVLRTGQPKYTGYGCAILNKESSGAEEELAILSNQGVFIRGAAGLSVTSLTTDYLTIAGDVGNKSCIAANVNAMSSNNASLVIKHSGVYTKLESDGVIRCPNYTLEIDGTSGDISNPGIILHSSTFGSAKKFKITVDDTGVPSFTDTGDATNKFTPVTPSELAKKQNTLTDSDKQSIVKTGMTSGAAWTSAEQKAARERMGIPGDYELIEEITISEAIESFIRESTPDGTPYSLAGFFCVITSPGVDDTIALSQTIFAGGTSLYNYGVRAIDTSVNAKSVLFACVNNKILHAEQYPVGVTYEFANVTRFAKKFVPDGSSITKVQFNGNIPVNTKITIYGVIA